MLSIKMYCHPDDPVDQVSPPFVIEVAECAPGVYALTVDNVTTVSFTYRPDENPWLRHLVERAYAGRAVPALPSPRSAAM